jgi:hypothetical protein
MVRQVPELVRCATFRRLGALALRAFSPTRNNAYCALLARKIELRRAQHRYRPQEAGQVACPPGAPSRIVPRSPAARVCAAPPDLKGSTKLGRGAGGIHSANPFSCPVDGIGSRQRYPKVYIFIRQQFRGHELLSHAEVAEDSSRHQSQTPYQRLTGSTPSASSNQRIPETAKGSARNRDACGAKLKCYTGTA